MKYSLLILLAFLTFVFPMSGNENQFQWPDGKASAVCLTYDDALSTQLDSAIPDLDSFNIKGTFFLNGSAIKIERMHEWRSAAKNGHELANHSIFHPCKSKHKWVPEKFGSEYYTVKKMIAELTAMNTFLFAIDSQTVRTFGYNCNENIADGRSFTDTLRELPLFIGCRTGKYKIVTDIKSLDPYMVPSMVIWDEPLESMINWVKDARKSKGLVVFQFHGVGSQSMKVGRKEHREIIAYLDANKETIWTATFREIMQHVIAEKKRLGW